MNTYIGGNQKIKYIMRGICKRKYILTYIRFKSTKTQFLFY